MPDFKTIYARHADQYERMVSFEDYQGNLLKAIQRIRPPAGLDVVEMGAGTGRLTCLLAPLVRSLRAFDASAHMLGVAAARLQALQASGLGNGSLAVADHRALPLADGVADLVLEGWSFGHFVGWHPDTWRDELRRALAEMRRVLRPGGTMILIETLGTGREAPLPPHDGLAACYAFIEAEYGFSSTWIRTDYRFASRAQGEALLRFFFDDLPYAVLSENPFIVPECTGLWWRTV